MAPACSLGGHQKARDLRYGQRSQLECQVTLKRAAGYSSHSHHPEFFVK